MADANKETTKHPDIGKRVRWACKDERGEGILLAVDCDESEMPHLVKRNDSGGILMDRRFEYCRVAIAQGVDENETDCYWVSSYEVIEEPLGFTPGMIVRDEDLRLFYYSKLLPKILNKKPMSKLITFLRNMTRDADSKLLIEAWLENEDGTPTNQGYEMSRELSYKANRAQIIDIVKQARAEEKK